MKKERDEDLDKLFKKGLEDPVSEATYREADWDAMEQMLDKPKKRGVIVYWLPILSSAAAVVLLFLGWMLFRPEVVKPIKPGQVIAVHQPHSVVPVVHPGYTQNNKPGTRGEPLRNAADSNDHKKLAPAIYAENQDRSGHGHKNKSFFTLSSGKVRGDTAGQNEKELNIYNNKATGTLASNDLVKTSSKEAAINQSLIANYPVPNKKDPDSVDANATDVAKDPATADGRKEVGTADSNDKGKEVIALNKPVPADSGRQVKIKKTAIQKGFGNRPQFAIGVLASSDLNGVNSSFQQSKLGTNFGVVFAVTFNKLTISTGATYAIKPYLTGFNNYHTNYQFPTTPSSVYANCRMLDIPLNLNYQVYRRQANSITLGTGLSSYFMLREDYKFNYSVYNAYSNGPTNYTVINKNHNILSVLNFDATYTHQINSKVGVTLQPYLKVPLSDVGASQVRLQTTGVALGLSWNINAASKPK